MKTTNLYFLSLAAKNLDLKEFSKYEAVLSEREAVKSHKKHEVDTLVDFVNAVFPYLECPDLDGYNFTFEITQLGREFDLLKVSENKVLNIELKSQMTTIGELKKQLVQNRHFFMHLSREIFQFVYVKNQNCFYQLLGDDLDAVEIETLVAVMKQLNKSCVENLSELFKPSQFLVSPLNTPEKFLAGEYFLTDSQVDIKGKIIGGIENKRKDKPCFFAVKGSPGTGKTLLLYDIAKNLARDKKVCVFHCGIPCNGHFRINEYKDSLTVKAIKKECEVEYFKYDVILFDEAHRIRKYQYDDIIDKIRKHNLSAVFSFDPRQILSRNEEQADIKSSVERLCGNSVFTLNNKIRTNKEMASFIRHLMFLNDSSKKENYANVELLYVNDYKQANKLIEYFRGKGYEYISFTPSTYYSCRMDKLWKGTNTHEVIGQEFDNIVMAFDDTFSYDDKGYLSATAHPNPDYLYKKLLFQGVTRVREKLALIVIDNQSVFENILNLLRPNEADAETKNSGE
ncbi:MAG: ATP-binding protein [Clostridia bacterium]|nr:ATP-binding protein [Clostridia bacterium]